MVVAGAAELKDVCVVPVTATAPKSQQAQRQLPGSQDRSRSPRKADDAKIIDGRRIAAALSASASKTVK